MHCAAICTRPKPPNNANLNANARNKCRPRTQFRTTRSVFCLGPQSSQSLPHESALIAHVWNAQCIFGSVLNVRCIFGSLFASRRVIHARCSARCSALSAVQMYSRCTQRSYLLDPLCSLLPNISTTSDTVLDPEYYAPIPPLPRGLSRQYHSPQPSYHTTPVLYGVCWLVPQSRYSEQY